MKSVRQKAIWKSRRPKFSLKDSLQESHVKSQAKSDVVYLSFSLRKGKNQNIYLSKNYMPGLATEAGQKAVELKPDLILMDVGLPSLSGSANSPSYSGI